MKKKPTQSNALNWIRQSPLGRHLRIYHPYLFAIYPVVALFTRNALEVNFWETLLPIFIFVLVTFLLSSILPLVIKPVDRASMVTSLILLFLFQYGYYYKFPDYLYLIGFPVNRHIIILFFWVIFGAVVANRRVWSQVRPHMITRYLNLLALISFIFPLRSIISLAYSASQDPLRDWEPALQPIRISPEITLPSDLPDIYYIILDGYARQDVLREIYNYDNSSFLNALDARGFYVANNSHSNYVQTLLSLSSSLNLTYLDSLEFAADLSPNRKPLRKLIQNNRLVNFLKEQGYTIISLDDGIKDISEIGTDLFLTPYPKKTSIFEALLFDTSAFRIPFILLNQPMPISQYKLHQGLVLHSFNKLGMLADQKGVNFVFAHILAPHPPFVFNSNGDPLFPDLPYLMGDGSSYVGGTEEYIYSYTEELTFINRLVLDTIDQILKTSKQKPIIIIQGDHGPGAFLDLGSLENSCEFERTAILNAYFLPDQEKLYPSISPVNTFRIIFDSYFNTSLGTLPDKAYFSLWLDPYDFVDVTDKGIEDCKLPGFNPN